MRKIFLDPKPQVFTADPILDFKKYYCNLKADLYVLNI